MLVISLLELLDLQENEVAEAATRHQGASSRTCKTPCCLFVVERPPPLAASGESLAVIYKLGSSKIVKQF